MLKEVHISGFKSVVSATLHLSEVSLLIGWNGSGKSNVLEALELLCWCSASPRLSDLNHAIDGQLVRIRGNAVDLAPMHAPRSTLGFRVKTQADPAAPVFTGGRVHNLGLGELELHLRLAQESSGIAVAAESLVSSTLVDAGFRQPLYTAHPRAGLSRTLDVQYQNFRRGKNPTVEASSNQPCFVQLTTPARFDARYDDSREVIPAAARYISDVLTRVHFLDPAPNAMRNYAYKDEDRLQLNGQNVSAVLNRLVTKEEREDEVLAFIAGLPECKITGITFLHTPRAEVMVQLTETFGGREQQLPAALMSDGTLRVLAIAAALLTAVPGSLVVIEEIDNGVHPSRASDLLSAIRKVARDRRLKVLITTHNPALQDALPDDLIPNVTLAHRDPGTGETLLTRLQDLPAYPRLVAAGPLGRLVTQGSFHRIVRDGGDAKRHIPDWLAAEEAP